MSNDKHIWEGWTVQDFIDDLEQIFDSHFKVAYSPFYKEVTKKEVRDWCKDNQPYYKKHIPEVANYFIKKAGL
jgi:hypothetical protein